MLKVLGNNRTEIRKVLSNILSVWDEVGNEKLHEPEGDRKAPVPAASWSWVSHPGRRSPPGAAKPIWFLPDPRSLYLRVNCSVLNTKQNGVRKHTGER